MKTFNKVLALVIAIITVVAMLPISAFADAWVEVGSKTEGSSSTVTVTLDAGTLADILERDGISTTLLKDLAAGVSVDVDALKAAFTVEELLEIIPRESWLEIFNIEEIIETLGVETLMGYADLAALLKSTDPAKLAALLSTVPDLENDIHVEKLLNDGFIDTEIILDHLDKDALIADLDVEKVKTEALKLSVEELTAILDIEKVVDAGLLDLEAAVDIAGAQTALADADVEAMINDGCIDANALLEYVLAKGVQPTEMALKYTNADGSVNYKKLVEDGVITVPELLENGLVDVEKLVAKEYLDVNSALNMTEVKKQLATADADVLKGCVNFNNTSLDFALNIIGGYSQAMHYINVPQLVIDIHLENMISKMHDQGHALEEYIDFNSLLDHIEVHDLLAAVHVSAIINQLDNNEIIEIVSKLGVKQYILPVLTTVADKILNNIDKVEIDGTVVAAENEEDGLLSVYASALVKAVAGIIPTLDEFASMKDGKVISTTVGLTYTVDGTETVKNKSLTFEFIIEGDITRLQNAAAKLSDILDRYVGALDLNGGVLTLDVTMPGVITKLYDKVVSTDKLPESLKTKILNLVNVDGNSIVAFTEALTWEEIIQVLDAVDPSALYESFKNISYVETVLEKVTEKTGYNLGALTLDDIADIIANVPSLERICEIVEEKTGRDIMAYIEALAIKVDPLLDRAQQIDAVQKILNKVEEKFNIDLSDISAVDILDRTKDAPISKTISDIIAAKVGVNIRAALENYTVDELYEIALEKAADKDGVFNKVKNYVLTIADMVPDQYMDISISDLYQGDGVFGVDKSITINAKELLEKLLDKVFEKVDLGVAEDALDFILSRIEGGEITVGVDLTIRSQGMYQITYMSRDGEKVLFTAYLAEGADLTVFKNNKEVTGYEFVDWTDAEGNPVLVMPASDTVVYADRNAWEVSFKDENGNLLGQIMVPKGDTLGDYIEKYNAISAKVQLPSGGDSRLHGGYLVAWYNGSTRVFPGSAIESDLTLVSKARPDYFLKFVNAEVDYDVTVDENGKYTIAVKGDLPAGFELDLDRAHLLTEATTENVSLVMNIDGKYNFLEIDNATLKALYGFGNNSVVFKYAPAETMPESFAGSYYDGVTDAQYFSFDILGDGVANHNKFGTIRIQMPCENAIKNEDSLDMKTNVYTIANGNRELVGGATEDGEYVYINAKHFSDFVVVNEYYLDLSFKTKGENGVSVSGAYLAGEANNGTYFPANAIINLTFELPNGYAVDHILVDGAAYTEATYQMPDRKVVMQVILTNGTYNVYYVVNGEVKYTDPVEAGAQLVVLDFKSMVAQEGWKPTDANAYANTGKWIGYTEGQRVESDMYLYAQWDCISYTVQYVQKNDDGTTTVVKEFLNVNVDNFVTEVVVPAVPQKNGMVGSWSAYQLNGQVATLTATYAPAEYSIITDGNVVAVPESGKLDAEITLNVVEKKGHDATVTVKTVKGDAVEVTNGKFKMPASNVYVTVTYTPKENLKYTVYGKAGSGTFGTSVPFNVTVNMGEVLVFSDAAKELCTLVSCTVDASGTKTYTYVFYLEEDNMVIDYTIETSNFSLFRIFNGKLFEGDGAPDGLAKDVEFLAWSETVAGSLQFATFTVVKSTSLLWLWILLIVLAVLALIILVYVLYITGKIGVNFFTRFIAWLVGLFFALCLGVSALGLKIASLFGYSDKAEDYGFQEKDENAEKLPEENSEEETAESAEESAEEKSDDSAENSEEGSTEESTEESSEENSEEVVEEAVAEETTEETTEEKPEEAAEDSDQEKKNNK